MSAITVPDDLEEMLQFVARQTGRPLEELIREALDQFLEEWENQHDAKDAHLALEAYQREGGGIPWEQVKQELGLR